MYPVLCFIAHVHICAHTHAHKHTMQVLAGDLEEAICTHAIYYSIWRRYSALPERFDWNTKTPNVKFYPLRPELVESTYLLYQVRNSTCLQQHSWYHFLDSIETAIVTRKLSCLWCINRKVEWRLTMTHRQLSIRSSSLSHKQESFL